MRKALVLPMSFFLVVAFATTASAWNFLNLWWPTWWPIHEVIVINETVHEPVVTGNGNDTITVTDTGAVIISASDPQPESTAIDSRGGNDTITNNGEVNVTAISFGNPLNLSSPSGPAGPSSDDNQEEEKGAQATGIQGNEGDDIVENTGKVTATAVTTVGDVAGGITGVTLDVGVPQGFAKAVGMDGGSGNDDLTNTGDVIASATAITLKAEITAELGILAGGDPALAKATAVGMQGGDGDDTIATGSTVSAVSTAFMGDVSGAGLGVAPTFTSSSAHRAEAISIGIAGGDGADTLTNKGVISAVSTALSDTVSVDMRVHGSSTTMANSEAITHATAVDMGNGNDSVTNEATGTLSAVASSVAIGQTVVVSDSYVSLWSLFTWDPWSMWSWNGETSAEATATGVETGFGDDNIENFGAISAVASSITETASAAVSAKNSVYADSTSKARSTATAINAGNGDDTILNTGEISAVSSATAGTLKLAFSATEGASVTEAFWKKKIIHQGGAYSTAEAVGISADGTESVTDTKTDVQDVTFEMAATAQYEKLGATGNDTITNENKVSAVATSVSGSGAVAVSISGAASAEAISKATSNATAVDAGAGNDVVKNSGDLNAVSTSTALSAGFSFSENKKGRAAADATAEAEATGISGDGIPASTVTEAAVFLNNGRLDSTFRYEKIAATGDDNIENSGEVNAVATAVSGSGSLSVSIKGANSAESKSTAKSSAVGIDAGGGDDTVSNTGAVTAVSTATADGIEISFSKDNKASTFKTWLKQAITGNGVLADAEAIGIRGDGTEASQEIEATFSVNFTGIDQGFHYENRGSTGDDTITNSETVTAVATAVAGEASVAVSIDGAAKADATAKAIAKATGIEAGAGDDNVENTGSVTAVSTATAGVLQGTFSKAKDADATTSWFDKLVVDQGAISEAEAIGIKGDGDAASHFIDEAFSIGPNGVNLQLGYRKAASSGDDSITNDGEVTAVATAVSGAGTAAISIEGDAKADAVSEATSRAAALDAGNGDDAVTNTGAITAVSTATAVSVGFSFSGNKELEQKAAGEVEVDATAEAESIGISGDGLLSGNVTEAVLNVTRWAIDAGFRHEQIAATGDDNIENSGEVTAVSTAVAGSGALSISIDGANSAAAKATAKASAVGIDAGGGNDTISNTGAVTAVSTATAGAIEISFSKEKDASTTTSWLKQAFSSNGATAEADAIGIRADGTEASSAIQTDLHIGFDSIQQAFHYQNVASTGNDVVTNSDAVTAVATAAAGEVSGSVSGDYVWIEGAAKADATAKATAKATAIEAGAGDDNVENTGAVTAVSTATAGVLEVTYSKAKVSDVTRNWLTKMILEYGAHAEAESVGIKGDGSKPSYFIDETFSIEADGVNVNASFEKAASSGADTITNHGAVTAVATALSGAGSAAASAEGAAKADSSSNAKSTAIAVDAGVGNDIVTNTGELTAVSTATALAIGVGLSENKGATATAGATSEAEAVGISGDGTLGSSLAEATLHVDLQGFSAEAGLALTSASGTDTITNDEAVTAVATAVSGTGSAAISLEGTASANISSSAKATATAIDAGSGNDIVTNNGTVTAVSTATAAAFKAAIAAEGAAWTFGSIFTGGTDAQATAKGITGDSTGKDFSTLSTVDVDFTKTDVRVANETSYVRAGGDDMITNNGVVTATAVSTSPLIDVSIGVDGAAAATSTATASSKAMAIDAGTGNDTVANSGELVATSVSTAEAVNIAVAKGVAVVGNKIWTGHTKASAEAVGISGDGEGRDWTASGVVSVTDEAVRLGTHLATTVVSGNDNIENSGAVVATAVSAVPSIAVAVSVDSGGAAVTTVSADASAVGIDAGAGDDKVLNSGEIAATSTATAAAMNIAATKSAALVGGSLWNGATTATSEAIGISGDGKGRDYSADGNIEVIGSNVGLYTQLSSTVVTGNDIIENDGAVVATSVATVPSLGVAVSVEGAAGAVSKAEADSRAVAVDAGAGDDTVINTGALVATSVATALDIEFAVSKDLSLAGNAIWDGATTATSKAIGISGDGKGHGLNATGSIHVVDGDVFLDALLSSTVVTGDDNIENSGAIAATAVAVSPSAAAAVSVEGVSAAMSTSKADASAVGIDAGAGNDTITNTGAIVATAEATAAAGNISISKALAVATGGLWDGGATAKSEAIGISGDGKGHDLAAMGNIDVVDGNVLLAAQLSSTMVTGQDNITNDGAIVATSVAVAPTLDAAVAVQGVAMAASKATADSYAVGIDAGSGNDTVLNNGTIAATSVANADAVSVALTPTGVAVAGGAIWDGAVTATSEAIGISGDGKGRDLNVMGDISVVDGNVHVGTQLSSTVVSGDDNIENNGAIAVTSVAAAPALGFAVAVEGLATSLSTAKAEATAVGIDAGAGNDRVLSTDTIAATSVAAADAISVSVTMGGVAAATDSFWDGGTTAEAEAIGISGDGKGHDLHATGNIEVADGDVLVSTELSSTMVTGDDNIENSGAVVATSVAEALSAGVSLAAEGVAAGSSTSTADSRAVAIDGGAGSDTITNTSGGALVATSVANANAVDVSVTGAGLAVAAPATFDGGTTAKSEAVGISGDGQGSDLDMSGDVRVTDEGVFLGAHLAVTAATGDDTITNDGTVAVTSVAAAPAVAVSVAVAGVAVTESQSTGESLAVAVDAGAGNDTVTNTGSLVSTSVANADTVSVSVAPAGVAIAAGAFWDGGTTAKSEAIGISGDGKGLDLHADGNIEITDDTIQVGTELSATAASGDDTITNEGTVVASSAAGVLTVDVSVDVGGVAGAVAAATADSRATAIDAGAGNDTITNSADLVGTSVATAISVPVGVSVYGVAGAANSFWDGGTKATSEAVGISGDGEGQDWLAVGTVETTETTALQNTHLSITAATGNDTIDNTGAITVTSVAEVPSVAVSVAVIGASAALSSATTESRAVAIDAGAGDDNVINSAKLVATAVANANSVNVAVTPGGVAVAGNLAWDGGTTAKAETFGISGDGKGRNYSADGNIEISIDTIGLEALLANEAASGDDNIENSGEIVATSVAAAPSVAVGVSVIGAAGAVSTATAEAMSFAIDAGAGNDRVTNSGELAATSVANADAINVAVGLLGGAVTADAFWNGGTTAKASAVGISGDGMGQNESIGGSTEVEVLTGLTRYSVGLTNEAASGDDVIDNDAKITATSVVVAPSIDVSVSAIGVAVSASSATAEAEAAAIDAGAGNDIVENSGELVASSVANANAVAVSVTPGGIAVAANGFFDGGVTATADAVGISGDGLERNESTEITTEVWGSDVQLETTISSEGASGNDTIINDGKITATSVAVAPAITESVTMAGISASVSTATAEATAAAIDAGAGDDNVENTGELVVSSVANADAENVTAALIGVAVAADSVWNGGTTATAEAVGISGDGLSPNQSTESNIEVIDGDVRFDTLVSSEAPTGNDTITNDGKVTATSVVVAPAISESINIIGAAAAMSTATAESTAIAIDAGAGNDTVTNTGELEATAVANADAISLSISMVGGSVAADAVWDGGTRAKAEAIGISGDGVNNDESTEATVEFIGGEVELGLLTDEEAASGNDTITNTNTIKATSTAVVPSITVASNLLGLSAAMSTSTAEARAAAIDAGDGDDTVDNSGNLTAKSTANADAVSVAATLIGVTVAGTSAWDGGTKATAEAVGIGGDGAGSESIDRDIEINGDGMTLSELTVRESAGGDDTINNSGNVDVEAIAVTVGVDVSLTGIGVAAAVSTSTARADSAGIDAGVGEDTVTNSGDLTVKSDAVAVAVAVEVTPVGIGGVTDAVWDGGTKAESNAVGISGDGVGEKVTEKRSIVIAGSDVTIEDDTNSEDIGSRDIITNDGTVHVTADAHSTSVGVSAAVIGVSTALSTGTARSNAAGINAGGGGDEITNRAAVTAISTATATTVEAAVVPVGVSVLDTIWDGGTLAEAVSTGLDGGAGNDEIINQATVEAKSTATTTSVGVSASLVGIAGAFVAATADASATGIDGGDGTDTITNSGSLMTDAEATGEGTSVSVTFVGAAATDTSINATAKAIGLNGGSGDDTITNSGSLVTDAEATGKGTSVSVAVVGASAIDTSINSTAQAIGLDGGSGSDTVNNSGGILSTAKASATAAQVNVTLVGGAVHTPLDGNTEANAYAAGILGGDGADSLTNNAAITLDSNAEITADAVTVTIAGYGTADVSATATANAVGIDGGDGNDEIINHETITGTVKSKAPAKSVSVVLAGDGAANALATSHASSTGISGGKGDNEITNTGDIHLHSSAESEVGVVSVTLAGVAPVTAGSTSLAEATGIMGEGSINKIYNDANIEVVADINATASAASVTLAGASQADVSASGDAEATGMSLGMGSGGIGNFGAVDVDATATMTSTSSGFNLAGATHSDITVGATSVATGLHGGDGAGNSCIYNASSVDTNAHSTMTVYEDNVGIFGYAGTTGTTGADATSFGIAGGQGNDYADNVSTIHSSATSAMTQTDSTFTFAGTSSAGGSLTSSTNAVGIDGNAGNDTLSTSGRIDAIAHSSFTAGSHANNIFGQSSGATGTSGAFADAIGIAGGEGTDNIEVQSVVNSHATSSLTQTGSTFTFGGASSTGGTLTGLSQAFGVDTGNDSDYVIGSGSLTPTAVSTFHMSGAAHNVFGTAGASGSAGATTQATGMNTGAGADYVDSDTNITASATSTVTQNASTFTFGGATKAGLTVKAESSATGIDGGDSDDFIEERGNITLNVHSTLTESGSAFAFGGASEAVASVNASSYATGIDGGAGNDMIVNRGTMEAEVSGGHTARLDFTGGSSAVFGRASTAGFLGAFSSFNGMVGGGGNDVLANFGSIDLRALSLVFDDSSSFTWVGGSGAGGKFAAESTVIAMDAGSGNDFVRNEGQITTVAGSFLNIVNGAEAGLGNASASETSGAISTARGIVGGSGDDNIENLSTMNITAFCALDQWGSSFTAIGGSGNTGKIRSTCTTSGITGDSGNDTIISEGAINIESEAQMKSNIYTDVGGGSAETKGENHTSLYSVGLSGGGDDDSIRNADTIDMRGTLDIESTNEAFAGAGYADVDVTANGSLTADGIDGGTGNDILVNDGTIQMDLTSKVTGSSHAHGVLDYADAKMISTADALLVGIHDPSGTSHVVNNGTIDVLATADSTAHASRQGVPGTLVQHGYANAYAYGIKTGSGHDMIFNHGTINVKAIAKSNTGNATAVNVAISSGDGNDTIVNSGTISALTEIDGTPGYGTSIDTGSGHDTLALLDGTSIEGSIFLGGGDDTLVLTGSPVVTNGLVVAGSVADPFSGYDTATLYGSGTFTGVLFGFDEALKTGIGTYTVPELPVSVVEVIEGTLVVDGDYDFSPEGKYTPHINPDGNCGVMQINGTATLSGDMKIVADRGAFLDGTEYKVLTSDTSSGAFDNLEVPNTAILTFEAEQSAGNLDIEVDVASFETVADNPAEQAIAGYLDRLTPTSSGELNDVIGEFQRLSRPQFDQAFASVSPEQYAKSSREYRENSRKSFGALRGRLNSLRKSAAFASAGNGASPNVNLAALAGVPEKPCGLWHKGFVRGFNEEQPGVATLLPVTNDFSSFGFDTVFGRNVVAGFGRDQSEVTTTSEIAYGEGAVDGSRHFAYGSYTLDDHFYMDVALFKGDEDYNHQRELTIGALQGSTASEHDGESYSSYIETGGLLTSRSTMLQPFGSLEYIYFREDGFIESGGGPLGLRIEDTERDLLVSNLGVRATKMWAADHWTIMPEISLAWRYDIDPADYSTTASFVSAPGQYFVLDGKEDSPHALAIGASLDIANYGKFRSILDFTGELFTDDNRYDVEWRLEYNF
jgi:hypothetical protein